jgi:hypothetical protein
MSKFLMLLLCLCYHLIGVTQCLDSEESFKKYFQSNMATLDPVEGIWSVDRTVKIFGPSNSTDYYPQIERCAIIKNGDVFQICNISGRFDYLNCTLSKTTNDKLFLYNKIYKGSEALVKANFKAVNVGIFELGYIVPDEDMRFKSGGKSSPFTVAIEEKFIKVYPNESDLKKSKEEITYIPSSGSAFALSQEGLIVSNYHVIEGAKKITVKGINGDFSQSYDAKVVVEDKRNDIVILKVDNILLSAQIPYFLSPQVQDVGISIFCLGFPLRATMGDEVKLTNGIISSKTGFDGDITTYQISAPVQPGNSGGPLFDDKGQLIGIVSAKHTGAENVSYAIKISYLKSLSEIMDNPPKMPSVNLLNGKNLSEQVKLVKNFIYIVETE